MKLRMQFICLRVRYVICRHYFYILHFLIFISNYAQNILFVRYGHLLVSDFSDSVASIPPENLQHFIGVPRMREGMHDENQFANLQGNGHAPPRAVANRNALAVLFESMLPWVTYEDREDGGPDGANNQHNDQGQDNQ